MTRFFGAIGYAQTVRTAGVAEEVITERNYSGEEKRRSRYFRDSDAVLGEIKQQTRLEVIADGYALENYEDIRYAKLAGVAWTVETATVERPRLVLVLGDKYNGPEVEND